MRTITPPTERIPIGIVTIDGDPFEVRQHPEFTRFFFDLFNRIGQTSALSNTELEALLLSLDDAAIRLDSLASSLAQLRDALGAQQASEMVMQQGSPDALFPDVMQIGSFDPLATEVTLQL